MSDHTVESMLPEGWVPNDAAIYVFAHHDPECATWEAIIPEFSIAGMGASANDAFVNAMELLDDYLVICARDGKSFVEARRPIGRRTTTAVLRDVAASFAAMKLRRPAGRRRQAYRVPLRQPLHFV